MYLKVHITLIVKEPSLRPGTIIIERVSNRFSVYWTERNEVYEQRYFEDEAEAVSYFLFLLEGSSNTYRKYVLEH